MKPKQGVWLIHNNGDQPAMKTRFADEVNVTMDSGAYSVKLPVLDTGKYYRRASRVEVIKSLLMAWTFRWFGKKIWV